MSNDIYFMEGYNDALAKPVSMIDCPYCPIRDPMKYHSWIEGYKTGCYECRRPFKDIESFQHTLERLSVMSTARSKQAFGFGPTDKPLTYWTTAIAGEVGELCNDLIREELGEGDHTVFMAKEAADIVIYIDLFCTAKGIDLCKAIRDKFNEVSDKKGSNIKF